MKKFILTGLLILGLTAFGVNAQSPQASSGAKISPTVTVDDRDIQLFKNKVATKVAELREKNNRAIAGFVIRSKDGLIHIKSSDATEYDVKTDDNLTQYFQINGSSKKEIKRDDIVKDDYVIISGILNDKTMDANVIYRDEYFFVASGKITAVNNVDFSLSIVDSEKDNITLDVEDSTKQYLLDVKTLELSKTGFSKIKEGDTIQLVAKRKDIRVPNKYAAVRYIVIPQEYFIK